MDQTLKKTDLDIRDTFEETEQALKKIDVSKDSGDSVKAESPETPRLEAVNPDASENKAEVAPKDTKLPEYLTLEIEPKDSEISKSPDEVSPRGVSGESE